MLSVVLASFALSAWQPEPFKVEGELDARGNSFSGIYDPVANAFVDTVQVVFASAVTYEGGLVENRFNGYGVLTGEALTDEGEVSVWRFAGTFVNGRLEGQGSYSDHLGSFIGEFSNSLPNGQGVYRSKSGWRYEGEFLAGRMTGTGTLYLADGSFSSGVFDDGLQVAAKG